MKKAYFMGKVTKRSQGIVGVAGKALDVFTGVGHVWWNNSFVHNGIISSRY